MFKRTYGWVQNPADFDKLKLVVQVFDQKSQHYAKLRESLVEELIPLTNVKNQLQQKLDRGETEFTYTELVGTKRDIHNRPASSRAEAVANGLLQITILPQKSKTSGKRWTDDWTADGYLRWALSFGFVSHDWNTDICAITPLGEQFSRSDEPVAKDPVFIGALMSYPPATRVLTVLEKASEPVTKFYIGDQLGFKGEKGFTSYTESGMKSWFMAADQEERKKLKANVEGTSDKYARMISGWLEKVGYVSKHRKKVQTPAGEISGFMEYDITVSGQHALRRANGSAKNQRVTKYLTWEFLATDAKNRDYVRIRRAHILNKLQSSSSINGLMQDLKKMGFADSEAVIRTDIRGFNTIGIRIDLDDTKAVLRDRVTKIAIPNLSVTSELREAEFETRKNELMQSTNLLPKYYELFEISYDGRRNRDFEVLTADIFRNAYAFHTRLLGGSRKPDIVVYTDTAGIIVDTKASSSEYRKNISEEDKMVRYIEDNKYRDTSRNSTAWWTAFDEDIPSDSFYFLWVSSEFVGQFSKQIISTSQRTSDLGAALNVEQLLLGADKAVRGELSPSQVVEYFNNEEIVWA